MKGVIRIGGALGVGIVVILGALYVKNTYSEYSPGQVVVAAAPERTYIETQDSDGDGDKDWEEGLQEKLFETIETPTSTTPVADSEPYSPPTTFTGRFSEAFLEDYLQGKVNGEDYSDPSTLVGNAVTAIEQNTKSKRHTRLELTLVPSTFESIRAYGNQIPEIVALHSIKNENEMNILQRALDANDPEILRALAPIRDVYVGMITDSLQTEVPDVFVSEHINLLNAYEAILLDIEAMQMAFDDPLYSLARVRNYEADALSMFNAFQAIGKKLTESGITYTTDERGAFFYLFEI